MGGDRGGIRRGMEGYRGCMGEVEASWGRGEGYMWVGEMGRKERYVGGGIIIVPLTHMHIALKSFPFRKHTRITFEYKQNM